MGFNEAKFKKIVRPYLMKCRDGDWEHALRVVSWVKKLSKGRKDLNLLVIAAYLHDIGWYEILPKGKIKFEELLAHEEKANSNSSLMVKKILGPLGFSSAKISKVSRFINAADRHSAEKKDEEIIVDADNLSKLDINHLKEKFKESEWLKIVNFWREKFPKRIKTETGKSIYSKLLLKLEEEVKDCLQNRF